VAAFSLPATLSIVMNMFGEGAERKPVTLQVTKGQREHTLADPIDLAA
jgi:hypothetical protein